MNTPDGRTTVIPYCADDWVVSPEHDLTYALLEPSVGSGFAIDTSIFVSRNAIDRWDIGLGDEVFLTGRFINHDGKQKNLPSLRWGHVAMMPGEPVYHPSNCTNEQESFLIEIHTMPGYSGSPVFVRPFVTSKIILSTEPVRCPDLSAGPWLLGVEWGYINSHNQELNTSMSGVVPAWHLRNLLDTIDARKVRKRIQESPAKAQSS